MSNLDDSIKEADGRIRRDVRRLERDVAASREDIEANSAEYLVNAMDELEESLAEIYDMVADRSARSIELVERTVEERPWTSLLAAFGAGCLVTMLISRLR